MGVVKGYSRDKSLSKSLNKRFTKSEETPGVKLLLEIVRRCTLFWGPKSGYAVGANRMPITMLLVEVKAVGVPCYQHILLYQR